MKRRKRAADESSLELLLDTICNTFGGILFLALLVCLMVGQRSPSREPDRSEPPADPVEVTKTTAEAEALKTALGVRRAAVRTVPGTDPELLLRWLRISGQEARLRMESRDLTTRLQAHRGAVAPVAESDPRVKKAVAAEERARNDLLEAEAEVRKSLERLSAAHSEAEAQRRKNTVQLRLPQERVTGKLQVAWVLSGSRLYTPLRYDSAGQVSGFDPLQVRLRSNTSFNADDLISQAGLPIAKGHDIAAMVAAKLRGVESDRQFIGLLVYPDSYEAFQRVREVLTNAGYEYQVIVLLEDGKIALGNSSRRVQ